MPIRDPVKRKENHRRYMREVWYPKNKAKQIANNLVYKAKVQARVTAIKLERGCADCGYKESAVALDFHHTGKKLFRLSRAGNIGASWARIEAEIAGCIVLCANCHRIRTWQA